MRYIVSLKRKNSMSEFERGRHKRDEVIAKNERVA